MIKLKDTHKSLLILLVVVFSFAFITKVIATMSPYAPGATRNPACSPTDANCTVDIVSRSNLYKENAPTTATNTTTGLDSVAIGKNNTVTANNAIAIGQGSNGEFAGAKAAGNFSLALGSDSVAEGKASAALGYGTWATGDFSVALGFMSKTYSAQEVNIGPNPTTYTPGSTTEWVNTDRLFNVGNGEGRNQSDAFTILKNGQVGIGNANPRVALDINSTGAIRLPVGETVDRPTPTDGLLRFNRTTSQLEYSNTDNWVAIGGSGGGGSSYQFYSEGTPESGFVAPQAVGLNSVAIGEGAVASTYGQVTLGLFSASAQAEDVPAGGGQAVNINATDPILLVGNGDKRNASNALVILKNGQVGIGISPNQVGIKNTHAMDFLSGAHVTAAGSFVDASDQALKENVRDLPYGLDAVNQMQPRSFDYVIDGSESIGFIAQEMENVVPEVVSGNDGHKGISYGQLTAVLVNAVQELSDRVVQLEASQGITQTTTTNNNPPPSSSGDTNTSTSSSTPPSSGNSSSTEGEVQGASIIRTTNDMNLTNALLFAGLALLLANLIIMLKKPFPSKK